MFVNFIKISMGIGLIIGGVILEVLWLGFLFTSVLGVILVLIFAPHLLFMPWTICMVAGMALIGSANNKMDISRNSTSKYNTVDMYDNSVDEYVEVVEQKSNNKKLDTYTTVPKDTLDISRTYRHDSNFVETEEGTKAISTPNNVREIDYTEVSSNDITAPNFESLNINKKEIKKDSTIVICPSCGLIKKTKITYSENINIKCNECGKIYSVILNSIDQEKIKRLRGEKAKKIHGKDISKLRCPKCGEIKIINNSIRTLKNSSTKCNKCLKMYSIFTNTIDFYVEKENYLIESQSRNDNLNEYFDEYEDAIRYAKMNPGKVVKRSPNSNGYVLTDMEQL